MLDRIPRLASLVTDDELLVGAPRDEAEHALVASLRLDPNDVETVATLQAVRALRSRGR